MKNRPPKFFSNFLQWPVDRSNRTFRAFVVEPRQYQPNDPDQIFDAALNALISQQPDLVDEFGGSNSAGSFEQFDLLTFPEAFLPDDHLLVTLGRLEHSPLTGCVHVGLRPSGDQQGHLFSVPQLRKLLGGLSALGSVNKSDLEPFARWLNVQRSDSRLNIGCLFAISANDELRICLHPKLVRSKYEFGLLPEDHMDEANLLTVVTLRPTDKTYFSVTIQPLICSDVLNLSTDRGGSRPLEAIHHDAECLGDVPPDHIDVVSVATCTPQIETISAKSNTYRVWHDEFRKSFVRAAQDDALARHHFATFVLSNFNAVVGGAPGGLSGAFIPLPPDSGRADFVTISQWGRPASDRTASNCWSTPDDDHGGWSGLGYIASLNPFGEGRDSAARMFGFTLPKLPRDIPLWNAKLGIVKCAVKFADPSGSPLAFTSRCP